MTTEQPHLAVRGDATLETDPEIARITVTVTARGTDRRTTLNDLTQRNAQALDLIKSYGEAVEKTETGALTLTPELREGRRGERIRAYHGGVRIGVTLTDFTALGELTTRLADLELTAVDGTYWALRPDSPAYRDARQQAVRAAVQRAREYAEALGSHLIALLDLSDEGLDQGSPHRPRSNGFASRIALAASQSAPEDAPALDLEPQRQTIRAQVTARFTISPPDLG